VVIKQDDATKPSDPVPDWSAIGKSTNGMVRRLYQEQPGLGFGAMRITGDGVWGEPANRAEAIRVLRRAVELGINFIDTADSYGPGVSEEIIADAYLNEKMVVKPFWEAPVELANIIDVGLRCHHVATYYAAPLLTARQRGLIVNISFYGDAKVHDPAY
jgi:hypothetical protein